MEKERQNALEMAKKEKAQKEEEGKEKKRRALSLTLLFYMLSDMISFTYRFYRGGQNLQTKYAGFLDQL